METKPNARGLKAVETALAAAATSPTVMKFGGTSVADAACLRRVAGIAAEAAGAGVIVVVSALAGVTDQLVNCTTAVEWGQAAHALGTLGALRARHEAIAAEVLPAPAHHAYAAHVAALVAWAEELCRRAAARGLLAPEEAAEITGLGERLAAPLLASAIAATGQRSQAVSATELISLDPGGEPNMAQTTPRCRARLRPLLRRGIVPVVTGYICRRHDTAPATLGRGGSDYSATLIAAAMAAREAVIWTDVDGMHAADPRLAPGAGVLAELSYEEAACLAQTGAKVLHPKCLEPARAAGIPIEIRNSFHPERPGTRVGVTTTARASQEAANLTPGLAPDWAASLAPSLVGLTVLPNQALLVFRDPAGVVSAHCQAQASAALASLDGGPAYRFLPGDGTLAAAVADAQGPAALAAWRRALGLPAEDARLQLERRIAVISAVGRSATNAEIAARGGAALGRAGIRCLAAGASAPPGAVSQPGTSAARTGGMIFWFAVAQTGLAAALAALHGEFFGAASADLAAPSPPPAIRRRGETGRRVFHPEPAPSPDRPADGGKQEWRSA